MAEDAHPEIVIVKRHGGHAEGHHGGAWKIAFADFMTAMMALFLVLWLISATNPKQRIVIAHYFNPVRLAETSADKKGLKDPTGNGPSKTSASDGESKDSHLELPPMQEKRALFDRGQSSEAALFRDPYAVLSEIVSQSRLGGGAQTQGNGKGPNTKSEADVSPDIPDTFRDPFATIPQSEPQPAAPDTITAANAQSSSAASVAAGASDQGEKKSGSAAVASGDAGSNVNGADAAAAQSSPKAQGPASAAAKTAEAEQAGNAAAMVAPAKESKEAKEAKDKAALRPQAGGNGQGANGSGQARGGTSEQSRAQQQMADVRANEGEAGKLRSEIANAVHVDPRNVPNVEVKATEEGVSISLTDETNYAMFSVGSAEPQAKTIEVMEKIAQLLKGRPGLIVVRGHTDGRPYKSAAYDNWQLSAARAQMAHYMLVRGGLDDKRIDRIEGYADHRLKIGNDPLAAENRRIEILLRKDKPQ